MPNQVKIDIFQFVDKLEIEKQASPEEWQWFFEMVQAFLSDSDQILEDYLEKDKNSILAKSLKVFDKIQVGDVDLPLIKEKMEVAAINDIKALYLKLDDIRLNIKRMKKSNQAISGVSGLMFELRESFGLFVKNRLTMPLVAAAIVLSLVSESNHKPSEFSNNVHTAKGTKEGVFLN